MSLTLSPIQNRNRSPGFPRILMRVKEVPSGASREQNRTRTASYSRELLVFLLVCAVATSLENRPFSCKNMNLGVRPGHQQNQSQAFLGFDGGRDRD